jgi:predicted transcriptional regulator
VSVRPKPVEVVFPIQPYWVRLIAQRLKTLEFRRKWPDLNAPYRAAVYASGPVSALVGVVSISRVHTGSPECMARLSNQFCVPESEDEIQSYFAGASKGAALQIDSYSAFQTPLGLEDLRRMNFRPPQSFVYVKTYPELKEWLDKTQVCPPKSPQEELDLFGGCIGNEEASHRSRS